MKKYIFILMVLSFLWIIIGCQPQGNETVTYTVAFQTGEGGTQISAQEIENGGKVTKPVDPTRDGFQFTGRWMNGTFEWNFTQDIVTGNLTLMADWLEISSTPTTVSMVNENFTSSITWQQTNADLQKFTVSIKPSNSGTYQTIEGELNIDTAQTMHVVTFTPNVIPQGGSYSVKIEVSGETVETHDLIFGGAGTETNPFVVNRVSDIIFLLENTDYQNKHYKQLSNVLSTITEGIEITQSRKATFSGVYDGQGFSISFTGNGGLFHEITGSGVVKNLVIDSTTNLYAAESNLYPIGSIADKNAGLIQNISSNALLENARLQGTLPVFTTVDTTDLTTGAGGIVGINLETGIIRNVTVSGAGAVKAGRGIGGVSAYNFGLIEQAVVTATLPAGNQANTAKSSSTYSFGGGITGFNFGTIQQVSVSGRVFAQSAYAEVGNGNEGKNVAFGGIAGYNEGLITDSAFARSLSLKEFIDKSRAAELGDVANNLGVASIHGDLYVGGIAGINAGEIEHVYVGGALIAARDFAGGITGLTLAESSIKNAYVFAEVAIKNDAGTKITTPNTKTTLTTYEIAPNGFDTNTVVFKPLLNSQTNQTWVPGDLVAPKLPLFTTEDYNKVGNKFASSGILLWQQGTVTGVNIVLDSVVLPFGTSLQLEYVVSPSSAPDLYTTWTSSDESVIIITGEGSIKGIKAGTATITVTTRDGGFTDTIEVTVEDYTKVETVNVSSNEFTLPTPNNSTDRPQVEIDTVIKFNVELLPVNAQFKGYTLTSTNSRATVNGNEVTFVYGNTGPGNVSITISFEDSSLTSLEYRFLTFQKQEPTNVPISSVSITSAEITLPEFNNTIVRPEISVGTVITLSVLISPEDATDKGFTITSSNSRAVVSGNQVTFVQGSGLGNVSINVTFNDKTVGINGLFEFRFKTIG